MRLNNRSEALWEVTRLLCTRACPGCGFQPFADEPHYVDYGKRETWHIRCADAVGLLKANAPGSEGGANG